MSAVLEARRIAQSEIPIIDIAGLSAADLATRRTVAERIGRACRDTGFFYIVNHGVPAELRNAVFAEAKSFFDSPSEAKLPLDRKFSKINRGYEPMKSQTLEAGAPPDLKEGYYLGRDLPVDHPDVVAGKFNYGPNVWPDFQPGFRPVMERYQSQMERVARLLMRAMALSLGLPEDQFEAFCDEPVAILRILHYPPQPANAKPNEKGAGAHTDWGGVTILMQDEVGGLQVYDRNTDGWIHADPVPDAYIVNIGDMFARWTNDLYRSTLHRVVNASGRERYSVPFFFDGAADHLVECLAVCLAPGETPKYAPTTVSGHLMEMYRRSHGG